METQEICRQIFYANEVLKIINEDYAQDLAESARDGTNITLKPRHIMRQKVLQELQRLRQLLLNQP